jgi:hypothetical protein
MQTGEVARERFPQLRPAEVMGVVGAAGQQGLGRGLADKLRRGLVALAEPEGQDVVAAHARVGHLPDFRDAKVQDFWAGDWGEHVAEIGEPAARAYALRFCASAVQLAEPIAPSSS